LAVTVTGVPAATTDPWAGLTCSHSFGGLAAAVNGIVPPAERAALPTMKVMLGLVAWPVIAEGNTSELTFCPLIEALRVGRLVTYTATGMVIGGVVEPAVVTVTEPAYAPSANPPGCRKWSALKGYCR